jgi:hypothetical protein
MTIVGLISGHKPWLLLLEIQSGVTPGRTAPPQQIDQQMHRYFHGIFESEVNEINRPLVGTLGELELFRRDRTYIRGSDTNALMTTWTSS